MVRLRVRLALPLLLPVLASACSDAASTSPAPLPPPEQWPVPDSDLSMLERDVRVAGVLARHPPLVDQVEYTDGRREFIAVVDEDGAGVDAWVPAPGGAKRRRIPRERIAVLERADPEVALERRLAHLVRIEDDVAAGRLVPSAPSADTGAAEPATAASPGSETWNFESVDTLADLPGAIDVRWWPPQVADTASNAWEPEDTALGRSGIWALSAHRLGHDKRVVLQVTIAAERVAFEHSPGYWGAPMAELHGHWRLLVDGVERWIYVADMSADLGEAGRYPYERASITMGPGPHVVRFELQGCDTDATYFWGFDELRWDNVRSPAAAPTWGALDE